MAKNNYYAYFIESENTKGITDNWNSCSDFVAGKKARYKGFRTEQEAKEWLTGGAKYNYVTEKPELKPGIYFDAGTGRGIGVEVKVTDHNGTNLLDKVISAEKINEWGNYTIKNVTNNFGELFGCFLALTLALETNIKHIFGDSKLVIDYWSKGFIKRENLPADTTQLADKVAKLRRDFEKKGGSIEHVSGDINPADLGFHR
jgi:viroplasmin and RNaseH domain-containing protein